MHNARFVAVILTKGIIWVHLAADLGCWW